MNARSLLPKIDELRLIAQIKLPAFICITETWLNESVEDSLIHIPKYQICRHDRCFRRGGGTAIYIQDDICFTNITDAYPTPPDVDCLVLDVYSFRIALICIYIPPSLQSELLQEVHDFVTDFADRFLTSKPDHHLIIVGDMNKFNTQNLCLDLDLLDIVTKPTRQDNILDHILMSKDLANNYNRDRVIYDAPLASSDHLMITCVPDCVSSVASASRWHKVYDFRQSHINRLHQLANLVDWDALLYDGSDINEQWIRFHSCLLDLLKRSIPMKSIPITDKDKEWLSPITKMLIMDRWTAFRCGNWPLYRHLKNKVKEEIFKCKRIWAEKLMNTTNGLWKLVSKHRQNRCNGLSSLVNDFGAEDTLLDRLADQLEKHFANNDSCPPPEIDVDKDGDWCPEFSVHEVWRQLRRYSINKAPGSDGIPTRIYVELADYIASPLSAIFNQSCRQKRFPDQWKNGIIVPIPKVTPPQIDKLRYVTLLPVPSKILETLVRNSMRDKFESAYGPEQHGFRRNGSSTTALLKISNAAAKFYDDSSNFGAAILSYDLSSAFDCVNHKFAIERLLQLDFPHGFLKWLSSYLDARKGILRVKTSLSRPFKIEKGVPQGSVLGPAIFCTYVSGFSPNSQSVTAVKYADDFTLIVPLESDSEVDVQERINEETDNFSKWCKTKDLRMNLFEVEMHPSGASRA